VSRARIIDTHPQIDRPDAGIVAVTEFAVGTPERLRALLEASAAAWATLPWPETLLSITWLASLDDTRALAYVQWRDDSGFDAFARLQRPALAEHFRAALPDLAPAPPLFYRRYRSGVRPDAPVPGCIVIVAVEFESADEARQRAWIDLVFDAIDGEPSPPAGGISGHIHASLDRTRPRSNARARARSDRAPSGATSRPIPA
jgi:hypothetical protein